jgi:hypothetical protein
MNIIGDILGVRIESFHEHYLGFHLKFMINN